MFASITLATSAATTSNYEPSVLSFASITNGPFVETSGRIISCFGPMFGTGTVRFACTTTGLYYYGAYGSGVLATLTFQTSCAGVSQLDFTHLELATPFGNLISAKSLAGGAAVEGAELCPQPATPTPQPTTTPFDIGGTPVVVGGFAARLDQGRRSTELSEPHEEQGRMIVPVLAISLAAAAVLLMPVLYMARRRRR